MKVFVTGATGFIGGHLIPVLQKAGYTVSGLTRSEAGAAKLRQQGVEPVIGSTKDLEILKAAAAAADAVVHLAFNHEDFTKLDEYSTEDAAAVRAMGSVLKGKPLVVSSSVLFGKANISTPGVESITNAALPNPRIRTELAIDDLVKDGVVASVVRLPQVHDRRRQGLISFLVPQFRAAGAVAYLGDGSNKWAAAAISDVVEVYFAALKTSKPGARYNAVAEEGVSLRDIAEVLSSTLDLPLVAATAENAPQYFGGLVRLAGANINATSAITRRQLNWNPSGPSLVEDLKHLQLD